jgi:hypothetical protein
MMYMAAMPNYVGGLKTDTKNVETHINDGSIHEVN